MNLSLDISLAKKYKNPSQKIRVVSESWVGSEAYCPSCGNDIEKFPNNRPVGDFYCVQCNNEFELKSKGEKFGKKIVDGEYATMTNVIKTGENPNFFLLEYSRPPWRVEDFCVIPRHYFSLSLIEKRPPLSKNAKRRGWIGCYIWIQRIPRTGRVFIVKGGKEYSKKSVISNWKNTSFLKDVNDWEKGWTVDVMNVVESLKIKEFKLADIYSFENYFKQLHPDNYHIKDKIRQQLQILRDAGYLKFLGMGSYRLMM